MKIWLEPVMRPGEVTLLGTKAIVQAPRTLFGRPQKPGELKQRAAGFVGWIYNCMFVQYIRRKPNVQASSGGF